jgi:hypothetical protein
MKISMEFKDMRDMLLSLPKFVQLVATDAPFQERMATALEPDPEILKIEVKSADGTPFTVEEKEKLADLLTEFAKDPDNFVANYEAKHGPLPEQPAEKAPEAAPEATAETKPAKTSKSPAKADEPAKAPKKASDEVKETDVRAAFAKLIKAGQRDKVKAILDGFGAANLPELQAEHYAAALAAAEEALA